MGKVLRVMSSPEANRIHHARESALRMYRIYRRAGFGPQRAMDEVRIMELDQASESTLPHFLRADCALGSFFALRYLQIIELRAQRRAAWAKRGSMESIPYLPHTIHPRHKI